MISREYMQQPKRKKKKNILNERSHSPKRAGDRGDKEQTDCYENGTHLHPLRTW